MTRHCLLLPCLFQSFPWGLGQHTSGPSIRSNSRLIKQNKLLGSPLQPFGWLNRLHKLKENTQARFSFHQMSSSFSRMLAYLHVGNVSKIWLQHQCLNSQFHLKKKMQIDSPFHYVLLLQPSIPVSLTEPPHPRWQQASPEIWHNADKAFGNRCICCAHFKFNLSPKKLISHLMQQSQMLGGEGQLLFGRGYSE